MGNRNRYWYQNQQGKTNARHKFFLHLRKIPYIIQIAAIAISVMQMPNVNITDLFNSRTRLPVVE